MDEWSGFPAVANASFTHSSETLSVAPGCRARRQRSSARSAAGSRPPLPRARARPINPDAGLAVDQTVIANAAVADFAPGRLGNNLVVRAARAEATATCTANGPVLSGSGEVPAVVLGGRTLDVTPLEQVVERLPTGEINVATGGPAARVRCGRGNDVGRFNINERKRVKGCERRYSIR